MLFEICCGTKPFSVKAGDRRVKLAYAHVRTPPPIPSSLRPDIPNGIEKIILKCLQKKAENRYKSFREIRAELATVYQEVTGKRFSREQPDEVKLVG